MIALGSKSYPYLAVAQHYGIDYGKVLQYVDYLEIRYSQSPPYTDWRISVLAAYNDEMQRRKQVLGVSLSG